MSDMEISVAWPDTYDRSYIHQFQPEPTHKIQEQQQKHWVERYPPTEHLLNDPEDHPNQHQNSHKLSDEKRHPVMSFTESHWKLRKLHDQNLPMEENP